MKVKDLPKDDRPREKLLKHGAENLSKSELLAILLRTGAKGKSVMNISRDLIKKFGSLNNIAQKTAAELAKERGIGKDKAATLLAAFELARRMEFEKSSLEGKSITNPKDVARYFIPKLKSEVKENFLVVCLNTANKIIATVTISIGTLNSSVVHPREVFKVAIDNLAASVILVHNHPSGNLEPSFEDKKITEKLIEAGKIIDIKILDHIIIAGDNFFSFAEKGLI